jgi:hypothetical protein
MFMKMKPRFYKPITFLLSAILSTMLFGFTACAEPGTGPYVMNNEAVLTSLTISTAEAMAPGPITLEVWNDWDTPNVLAGEDARIINLRRDEDMVNVYLKPKTSPRARIAWGIGDQITRPPEFYDYRVPATFSNEDYIYIRVTSEDTTRTQYYRFYVFLMKKSTSLDELTVAGKKALKVEAAGTWDFKYLEAGTIDLTVPGATNAEVIAVGFEATSTFRFARVPKDSAAEPVFRAASRMTFSDEDTLYVEVTAENKVDKAVYKFVVLVGRIANLAKLSFDSTEVVSKGFPNAEWGSVSQGSFASADMPSGGWSIIIEKEDPGSTCEYRLTDGDPAAAPDTGWIEITATTSLAKVVFNNSNWLAIKVTSQGGPKERVGYRYEEERDANNRPVLDENGDRKKVRIEGTLHEGVRYYKINVELLAANFKQHPISAVYYYYKDPATVQEILHVDIRYGKDGKELPEEQWSEEELAPGSGIYIDYASPKPFESSTPVALDFVLDDRPGAVYTYQWYEANSWYGGYGFDPDGNVCYNISDSEGTVQFNYEKNFTPDIDHHLEFDEKGNPSLFNGGNQQASYVLPGRKIPDATGPTYLPRIDYRPFNMGYSNETHYYWVEVTDTTTGRKATSARASIVSERDFDRKHFMIDVNNDWKDENGMPLKFKNLEVFEAQSDKFRIPLSFLSDFEVTDWKILVAQAKFYLTDGRDWIQNWTNAWLSFEDNSNVKGTINPYGPVPADGRVLVLFYNLTNNNATYDITSDSKEPLGASLDDNPTHITIEPSGNRKKGPTGDGYPPLGPDGKAADSIVDQDLQGWFCGYIELVELRFEGPR